MTSDVAFPNDSPAIHEINGRKYHVCDICGKNFPIIIPVFTPVGGKTHCEACWILRNKESPSEYGKLGMKELLIKSILPTYEEIDVDSFEFTVDNHLELDHYFEFPGVKQTRGTTIDLKCRLKNGKTLEMHIE